MNNINYPLVPEYILRKLILLYGFNVELQQKNQLNRPNSQEKYFLINANWLGKFKEFYNYELISNFIKQNFNFKTYNDFENNINNIIMKIKNFNIPQKDIVFPTELSRNILFNPVQHKVNFESINIDFFEYFYIVNENLFNLFSNDKENNYPNYNSTNNRIFSMFFFWSKIYVFY